MTTPANTLTKLGDVRPSALLLNLAAIPFAFITIGGLVLVAMNLPGHRPPGPGDAWFTLGGIGLLLGLHELTHALAWQYRTRLPWAQFKFGFNPKALMVYCHCRAPMRVADYRWGALAPLVALGALTMLLLVLHPAFWLAVTAGLHLAACIGDLAIVAGLRRFPADALVRDHPTEAGCEVFAPAEVE